VQVVVSAQRVDLTSHALRVADAAQATLGAQTRVLDGATATAVLTAAVDPYQAIDASWPRTPAHRAVTARHYDQEPQP
jgi:hypothetical protein